MKLAILGSSGKAKLFSLLRRAVLLVAGKGLGRIPGSIAIVKFLFSLFSPEVIDVEGSKMYMAPHEALFFCALASNTIDPFMTEIFKRVVRKGDIVVDLGAGVGYYTLLASRIVGKQGKVYAFEPDPKTYNLLVRNIELNKYSNVAAVPKAVTNKVGTAKLFLFLDPGRDTLYKAKGHERFVEVETETLDHFSQDKDDAINIIKIDIEGGEMDALSGMDRLINRNRNLKMFIEFCSAHIKRSGYSPEKFLHKLWNYNFKVFAIDEKGERLKYINKFDELMAIYGNQIAINLFVTRHYSNLGKLKSEINDR